jgi:hypothetical protein
LTGLAAALAGLAAAALTRLIGLMGPALRPALAGLRTALAALVWRVGAALRAALAGLGSSGLIGIIRHTVSP